MSTSSRHTLLAIGLAGLIADFVVSHPALATDKVVLFKVKTAQNEIIIGLPRDELDRFPGKNAEGVSKALRDNGALTVWQYVARKRENGEIEQAPARRIGLNASDDLSVEPYETRARVVSVSEVAQDDLLDTGAL